MIEVPGKLKKRSKVSVTMGTHPWILETILRLDSCTSMTFYDPCDVDTDHLFQLKLVREHEGRIGTKRKVFANDSVDLLILHGVVGRQQGVPGPSYWMSPDILLRGRHNGKRQPVLLY